MICSNKFKKGRKWAKKKKMYILSVPFVSKVWCRCKMEATEIIVLFAWDPTEGAIASLKYGFEILNLDEIVAFTAVCAECKV